MKKPNIPLYLRKLIMAIILLLLHAAMTAQPQWYQGQDGGMQPNGTYANSILPFTGNSFIASYLWTIDNDQYTWKISRTSFGGQEIKKYFVSGTSAMIDVRAGNSGFVYVLLRDFPSGQNPVYTVLKLNSNLQVVKQKGLTFPGNFSVFNLGIFELDESDNVYLAGDGQYENATGIHPASFLVKADRNLTVKWNRMDSVETSYSAVHIDGTGKIIVVEDHYSTYPDVLISKFASNGQLVLRKIVSSDPGRISLYSKLDKHDNLLLYGVKSVTTGNQAIYLRKLSKFNFVNVYHKTLFSSPGIELNDMSLDGSSIYALVTRYNMDGEPSCLVSRINTANGHVSWNRNMPFQEDSCMLSKIVPGRQNRFFLVGQRLSQTYYAKGFAVRMKKNGHRENSYTTPDSVAFQRTHVLLGGIVDTDNRLIAIGNTNDFDTLTFASSYFRAFTIRPGTVQQGGGNGCERPGAEVVMQEAEQTTAPGVRVAVYPNPVSNELFVNNLQGDGTKWLVIYTMQGVPVLRINTPGRTASIDVSRLASGTYMLRVSMGVGKQDQAVTFIIRR